MKCPSSLHLKHLLFPILFLRLEVTKISLVQTTYVVEFLTFFFVLVVSLFC
jgi:hypothetical protein